MGKTSPVEISFVFSSEIMLLPAGVSTSRSNRSISFRPTLRSLIAHETKGRHLACYSLTFVVTATCGWLWSPSILELIRPRYDDGCRRVRRRLTRSSRHARLVVQVVGTYMIVDRAIERFGRVPGGFVVAIHGVALRANKGQSL
ncbi:hypothetical protein BDV93DRAFT_609022 [Ceratobasidium sp. AG-I]|nr:hypothetical protein BDV93DRAFT_609022 [Ceratobasidium sp. AG-I]